jgi:DNA adenine methylase
MHSVRSVRITNLDYSILLQPDGDHDDNTFVFCDPPYKIPYSLYGNKGDMHEGFDHQKFADTVKQCPAQWLITYNDDDQIKQWFVKYRQVPWDLQYKMKAAKREGQEGSATTGKSGKKGKELLIMNY